MAELFVPLDYPTIRAAITAAATDDTITISLGTYDIRDVFASGDLLGPATFSYTINNNCMTGFELVTSLNFLGNGSEAIAGTDATYITGSPRLYVANQDGFAPYNITFDGMELIYNETSPNYILQLGNFGVPEADTYTKIVSLNDLSFVGTHIGNNKANGNYAAVLGMESFNMTNCHVELTGQFSFVGTQANSGGSSFIMAQGGIIGQGISFKENFFDESGYRNALSIFDSAKVLVSNNTFYRSDPTTRYRRNSSEKIKNSTGAAVNNRFFDGSYLILEKDVFATPDQQVVVTGNTFAQFDSTLSVNPIIGGGAVGIVLQGANADTALFQPSLSTSGNNFNYVTPLINPTSTMIQLGANNITNPINNASQSISAFFTGGIVNDTIVGGNNQSDFLTGGLGNDTINTGSGSSPDFVLFNTPLNSATNVDTIANFNRTGGGAAIDRIILDRSIFKNITATYALSTSSVIGAVNAINVQSGTSATPSNSNVRIIYQTTTGNLYYDQDGSGSGFATTLFAKIFSNAAGTTPIPGIVGFSTAATINNVNIGIF